MANSLRGLFALPVVTVVTLVMRGLSETVALLAARQRITRPD